MSQAASLSRAFKPGLSNVVRWRNPSSFGVLKPNRKRDERARITQSFWASCYTGGSMKRRSFLFAAAAVAAMTVFGSAAQAANIVVNDDSGTLGTFTLTNNGIVGSTATLQLDFTSPAAQATDAINGVATVIPASFESPIFLDVTPVGGGVYTVVTSEHIKTFGDVVGSQAQLTFSLTTAVTPLNNFLNLQGLVTSVVLNALAFGGDTYDFSQYSTGLGLSNITLVGARFTGATSFAGLIENVGATATGSGSFSQVAVIPEPSSMALLGIGLSGLFT